MTYTLPHLAEHLSIVKDRLKIYFRHTLMIDFINWSFALKVNIKRRHWKLIKGVTIYKKNHCDSLLIRNRII